MTKKLTCLVGSNNPFSGNSSKHELDPCCRCTPFQLEGQNQARKVNFNCICPDKVNKLIVSPNLSALFGQCLANTSLSGLKIQLKDFLDLVFVISDKTKCAWWKRTRSTFWKIHVGPIPIAPIWETKTLNSDDIKLDGNMEHHSKSDRSNDWLLNHNWRFSNKLEGLSFFPSFLGGNYPITRPRK